MELFRKFAFLLLVVIFAALSACTGATDGEIEATQTETPDIITEEPGAEDEIAEDEIAPGTEELPVIFSAFSAYHEILSAAAELHGIVEETDAAHVTREPGVLFAKLFDFDGDEIPELIYTYKAYGRFSPAARIYGYAGNGEAVLIRSFESLHMGGVGVTDFGVATDGEGRVYLITIDGGWRESVEQRYYALEDGEWVTVLTRSWKIDDIYGEKHFVNGEEVSSDDYNAAPADKLGIVEDTSWPEKFYAPSSVREILAEISV